MGAPFPSQHRPPCACQAQTLMNPSTTGTKRQVLEVCPEQEDPEPHPLRAALGTAVLGQQDTHCDSVRFCWSARIIPSSCWTSSVSPY